MMSPVQCRVSYSNSRVHTGDTSNTAEWIERVQRRAVVVGLDAGSPGVLDVEGRMGAGRRTDAVDGEGEEGEEVHRR